MYNLYNYGWIVLAMLGVLIYFYHMYKTKGTRYSISYLRETIFKLMLIAEKKFGKGEGEFKFNWVVEELYSKMPNSFQYVFTREEVLKLVQSIYDDLKDYLDDGEINGSIA